MARNPPLKLPSACAKWLHGYAVANALQLHPPFIVGAEAPLEYGVVNLLKGS